MKPARQRRGRARSSPKPAPVNGNAREILELGGGIGGLHSQTFSSVGHGGDGSARTQQARARTEIEIDDEEEDASICGYFSGSDFLARATQHALKREEKKQRYCIL